MHDFHKRKKIKKIIYSPVVITLLVVILLILIKAVFGVYSKMILSKENLNRENIEYDKLLNRQKSLATSIEYLKTEQGIEGEIRTKFKAVKDGERVVVIVDNQSNNKAQIVEATSTKSIWYRILHWPQ